MPNREVDALVAEHVMGWHRYDDPYGEFLPDQGWDSDMAKCGVLPHFSTDPAAAFEMESAIPEEKRDAYSNELWQQVVNSFPEWRSKHAGYWYLIHATPAQRCDAAVAVLQGATAVATPQAETE